MAVTVQNGAAPSTATLSGGGDASAANQTTEIGHLATLAGAVAGGHVQADILSGGGGTVADGSDFTADTTLAMPIQGVYQSTHSDATDGDLATVRVSQDRALLVKAADASGNPVDAVADPADGATFTASTTTGAPIMGAYESSPSSVADGKLGAVGITTGRRLKTSATVDAALPAGTNAIGKLAANSGVDIGDVDVTSDPDSDGTPFNSIDLDETEEDIKTSAGRLLWYHLFNAHATDTRYVRFYNATAANVTVGTTATFFGPIPVKAGTAANCRVNVPFSTAISIAATTGSAANDTGAPGANEIIANILYK